MINDLWQLDKWVSVECILTPKPKGRTVLIAGEMTAGQPVNYSVVFKRKRELTAFALKYARYFEPIVYQDDYTIDEKLMMWNYFTTLSEHRHYSQGP